MYKSIVAFVLAIITFGQSWADFPKRTQHLKDISTIYSVPVAQDINVRVAFTAAKTPTRKVIIYVPGRASYFEKNTGLILALTGHDFLGSHGYQLKNQADVWCLDPRAQGGSGGRLENDSGTPDQRGHIEDFSDYSKDLHKAITTLILPAYQNQNVDFYLMGASMGGHIIIRYLQEYKDNLPVAFKGALGIVPMIAMDTSPWPELVAKTVVNGAKFAGFGDHYAIGYGDVHLDNPDFTRFKGHHNEFEFHDTNTVMLADMSLVTGGPTNQWVASAFESQIELKKHTLPDIPTTLFVAGQDTAVLSQASKEFATTNQVTVHEYPDSRHNIIKESKAYCGPFWQDLDATLK